MVKQSRLRIRARVNSKFKLKLKFWLVIRRFHLSWIVPGEVGKFLLKISFRCSLKSRLKLKSWNELGNFKIKGFVVHATKWAEFRFESPISISKWNNWLDFRPKSENYSTVKVFSDSRPKSAQKLILKVFSDFQTQIICRLSKIFKIFISCYSCAGMVFLFAKLFRDQNSVQLSDKPFAGLIMGSLWFLVVGTTVRLFLFWSIKDS